MKKKHLILIHLSFWIIFIFNKVLGSEFILSKVFKPLNITFLIVNVLAFYFNYFFIIPYLMKDKKVWKFILGFILSFFIFTFSRFAIEEILLPKLIGYGNYAEETSLSYYIFDNFYWGSNAIFISSLIWFLDYSVRISKENTKLLKEKNIAEISLLKSQINPHFIFNMLNNIYSLVNQKSDKSLNAIEKLGDLLRFSGTEINKDFTTLSNEIQYVRNYIDLESLRLSNPENVMFEDKIENKNLKISPMILIPFVENAFKHGNLKDAPLNILIETKGNQLHFYQKNKISNLEKDKSSGIGIENVRKRLSIIYPERHFLEISNKNGFYEVNLTIDL